MLKRLNTKQALLTFHMDAQLTKIKFSNFKIFHQKVFTLFNKHCCCY